MCSMMRASTLITHKHYPKEASKRQPRDSKTKRYYCACHLTMRSVAWLQRRSLTGIPRKLDYPRQSDYTTTVRMLHFVYSSTAILKLYWNYLRFHGVVWTVFFKVHGDRGSFSGRLWSRWSPPLIRNGALPYVVYINVTHFIVPSSSFFLIPFPILSLFFLSLLVVTQIRGHIHSRLCSLLPTTARALDFYREKTLALSSLVDPRRIVLQRVNNSSRECLCF